VEKGTWANMQEIREKCVLDKLASLTDKSPHTPILRNIKADIHNTCHSELMKHKWPIRFVTKEKARHLVDKDYWKW